MISAVKRDFPRQGNRAGLIIASLALAIGLATPALAQVPSMLGAPGLSPVGPAGTDSPPQAAAPMAMPPSSVVAPPELNAPPAGGAGASTCDTGMMKMRQRRDGAIEQINQMVKGGKGKKLDPAVACPRFRNLVAAETDMKNWMVKNKEWCSIPDQFIEDMKKSFSRTPVIANQACNAAAQVAKMKRMQAQQAQQAPSGGAGAPPPVKLPSGPL